MVCNICHIFLKYATLRRYTAADSKNPPAGGVPMGKVGEVYRVLKVNVRILISGNILTLEIFQQFLRSTPIVRSLGVSLLRAYVSTNFCHMFAPLLFDSQRNEGRS